MKEESSLGKLKRLVGESQEIRKGNLSGKKKVAKKMKVVHGSYPKHWSKERLERAEDEWRNDPNK